MRMEQNGGRRAPGDPLERAAWALALVAGILGGACGAEGRTQGYGALRVVPADGNLRLGVRSAERFGFGPAAPRGDAGFSAAGLPAAGPASATGAFAFEAPAGWQVLSPSSLRAVNLAVARDPRAECYLTVLAGTGGGLEANVDRWRAQMGLPSLAPEEYALLERATLLGRPALRVDFEGRFGGLDGAGGAEYRLVGLLAVHEAGSSFLKFVGPRAVVTAELAAFDALAASLRIPDSTPDPERGGQAGRPEAGAEGLLWQAPPGWTLGGERPLRAVTYHAGAAGEVECYVAVLGGDGGGVRSNLDRWRAQMGAGPLSAAELADLEHVPALGVRAVLIEVVGDYRGMGGEEVRGGALLGAVAVLDGRTVFVKLIGPREAVRREEASFRAFVASLEVAR